VPRETNFTWESVCPWLASKLSGSLLELYLWKTPITDFSPLAACTKLEVLDASATALVDLSVVSGRKFRSLVTNRPENCAIVFARTAEALSNADIGLFQELFSFTKAEARLAVGLASGMRLEDVERELKIRHNTARAHLRSMFSKAQVGRQSELVHLLVNSVVPLGRSKGS